MPSSLSQMRRSYSMRSLGQWVVSESQGLWEVWPSLSVYRVKFDWDYWTLSCYPQMRGWGEMGKDCKFTVRSICVRNPGAAFIHPFCAVTSQQGHHTWQHEWVSALKEPGLYSCTCGLLKQLVSTQKGLWDTQAVVMVLACRQSNW